MKNTIKKIREEKSLTQEALADLVGTSQQQIQRLENGERRLTSEWIKKLSTALNVSPIVFFENEIELKPVAGSFSEVKRPISKAFQNADTIPVYGYASSGDEGIILNPNFVAEQHERPYVLRDVQNGFMVYVSTDLMIPRYFPGERIIVHPHKIPKIGEDCLLEQRDNQGFVRIYKGQDKYSIFVSQYNPQKEIAVDRSMVKGIYAIIGRL